MISTTEIHVPSPVESRPGIVPLQECNYVNNEFITDVFTPVSVLCNQPLASHGLWIRCLASGGYSLSVLPRLPQDNNNQQNCNAEKPWS